MGDPLKPTNNKPNIIKPAINTSEDLPGNPIPPVQPSNSLTETIITPEPTQPIKNENKVAELVIPAMELEPIPEIKTEVQVPSPTINETTSKVVPPSVPVIKEGKGRGKLSLIIPLFIIVVIIAVGVGIYLFLKQKSNSEELRDINTNIQDSTIVSSPLGDSVRKFVGKVYDVTFDYNPELGLAKSTTAKNVSSEGECKIETVTFNNNTDLTLTISTGNCQGGITGSPDFTKITGADGKSYFIVVRKLDETIFTGKSTITVTGGLDNTNNFVNGLTGVRIDAIRISDVAKYQKYMEDILNTLKITLSPLKSDIFDETNNV